MLAVDNGCPAGSVIPPTNPNECGMAGQTNGICSVTECPRSTNPSSIQRVKYYQYAVSQRDFDNDGHENALDACYATANPSPGWDPRQNNVLSGSDADGDGLPTACDPNDGSFNNDQDGDGWQNRIDNCPLVANSEGAAQGGGTVPNTFQFDLDVPGGTNVPDGGPASDSIGVDCDTGAFGAGLVPGGANGHYHATYAAQTICIGVDPNPTNQNACNNAPGLAGGGSDDDNDGVTNASDTCRNGNNPPFTFTSGPGATTLSVAAGAGATTLNVASTAGFIQNQPIVIKTPLETLRYITAVGASTITINAGVSGAHASGSQVQQVSFAQSARDMNNDGFVDISDISLLTGVFGSQGGNPGNDGVGDSGVPGYQGRYDTNYDSFVDITDVSSLTGMFGNSC